MDSLMLILLLFFLFWHLGVYCFHQLNNSISANHHQNRHLFEMKIPNWVLFSGVIFLMIFSLFLISGERAKIWGGYFAAHDDINQAIQYYQKAVNSIPFNSQSHYLLSTYYRELFNTQKQAELRIKSEYHSEKATGYSPFDYRYQENKAVLRVEKGDFETGLNEFEKAIYLAPLYLQPMSTIYKPVYRLLILPYAI